MSVSTDRIGVTAMRCARLLEEIGDQRGKRLDLTGDDRVVEIYPAAALSAWGATVDGFDPKGYKTGPEAKTKRAALFDALVKATRGWLGMLDEAREACIKSDDVLDAFMAALATRAAQVGKTRNPETHAQRALAPVEGWIHVPLEGTLALLGGVTTLPRPPLPMQSRSAQPFAARRGVMEFASRIEARTSLTQNMSRGTLGNDHEGDVVRASVA